MMLDREAVLRNHLSSRHIDHISSDVEGMVRARISTGESVFRITEGNLLLVSTTQGTREARQFLAHLLAEPLALTGDDRTRTVSLPAIVRRSIFSSDGYLGPGPLAADLDAFFACNQPLPIPTFKNL